MHRYGFSSCTSEDANAANLERKRPAGERGVSRFRIGRDYSTLNFTDCRTLPSWTTSHRQSPAGFSPRVFELCVRQGEPPMWSFTRPTSVESLYQTCSMSLSVAFETLLKQYSFPASALNESAAPVSARSATAVPTAASTVAAAFAVPACSCADTRHGIAAEDRKSTRLNSSHTVISYAVFCLKKKKKKKEEIKDNTRKTETNHVN